MNASEAQTEAAFVHAAQKCLDAQNALNEALAAKQELIACRFEVLQCKAYRLLIDSYELQERIGRIQ